MQFDRRRILAGGALLLCAPANAFAQQQPGGQGTLFNNTFAHTVVPGAEFQYTFDDAELTDLVNRSSTSVIVHHGPVPATSNYTVLHHHFEGLPLFASKEVALGGIKLSDLRLLLAGQIDNWRALGGGNVPVDVGIRGDGVFLTSAQNMLRQKSLAVSPRAFSGNSYEELASYGNARPGALLVGLRGPAVKAPNLVELKLDGKTVSASTYADYPLSGQVSLLLRKNDARAVDLGHAFADGLKARLLDDDVRANGKPMIDDLDRALADIGNGK